jgi:hypothetical protein
LYLLGGIRKCEGSRDSINYPAKTMSYMDFFSINRIWQECCRDIKRVITLSS